MLRRLSIMLVTVTLLMAAPAPYFAQTVGPNLAREGDHFTLNGIPRFLFFVSYFDALHASESTWTTDLNYLQSIGVSGVRILPNWYADYCPNVPAADTLIRYDGTLNQTTLAKLQSFMAAASQRGMIVDVTFSTTVPDANGNLNQPFPAYKAGITAAAAALTAYRNVLFDVSNEYPLNGPSAPQVQEIIQAVHGVDAARIAAASEGEGAGSNARVYGFDFVAYHDSRDQGVWFTEPAISSRIAAIKQDLSPSIKPIHFQEPMPWGAFPGCSANNQQDPTPGHASQAARLARHYGAAGWTFHTRSGFELAGTSLLARLNLDSSQKSELEFAASTANLESTCWGASAVSPTPKTLAAPSTGATGTLAVSANGACQTGWAVTSNAPSWLTGSPGSGNGNGTVTYTVAPNLQAQVRQGTLTIGGGTFTVTQAASTVKTMNDFDGDGFADLVVWRNSDGGWYRTLSSAGYAQPGIGMQWGLSGDIPVPGDYDGDGKADLAVWRPSEGKWYIRYSSTNFTSGPAPLQWGLPGDIPVAADYDKDGKTDFAVFRPSGVSMGVWFIAFSSTNFTTSQATQWGLNGDRPLPGDYDGDGQIDLAVWRPSEANWYILNSQIGVTVTQWGFGDDLPVPADYDSDGKIDLAVWRPSEANWYIRKSHDGITITQWGFSNDVPVPGDFDGDHKADLAVWRPSEGNWYIRHSSTNTVHIYQWGLSIDTPLPGNGQPVTVR